MYKENELDKVIDFFLKQTEGLNVIGLSGNLGAGKTTFVKALLKSLGVAQNVVSPTFVLRGDYDIQSPPRPSPSGREQGPQDREIVSYLTGDLKNFDSLHRRAMEFKISPTEAEDFLWQHLRRNSLGSRFRRQHVVDHFIVDFINIKNNLIVEVDGGVHNNLKERYGERSKIFENLGFKVLRFTNDQVLGDIQNVLGEIQKHLTMSPAEQVLPEGEDLGGDDTEGVRRIIHIDAYRLEKPEQIYQVVSREELADKNSLVIVEWPELSENIFQKIFLFEHVDEHTRKISVKSV
jgi:very-short-patch-repair endonuclease/tRNA A37 threonylcarbamoyladenosine biosynthesis protein TsaE